MRIIGRFLAAAILAAPPTLAADRAEPPRDVTCVYQAIPPEMHRLVLDLFASLVERGTNPLEDPDARIAATAQISAAFGTCLDLHPLSSGESDTARDYALASLLADFSSEWLKANGADSQDVLRYYEANRMRLPFVQTPTAADIAETTASLPPELRQLPPRARQQMVSEWLRRKVGSRARRPNKLETAALVAHLKGRGWKFDNPMMEPMAAMFLYLQMQRALDRQAFAKGGFGN